MNDWHWETRFGFTLLALEVVQQCAGIMPVLHEKWSKIPPPELGNFSDVIRSLDTNYAPSWRLGLPVTVYAGMYIESLSNIKATEMAFDVDLYLRQSWFDSRLQHNQSRHYAITDLSLAKHVWKPDLFLANAKTAKFQTVTKRNQMLLIYPNGYVHYSVRVIATVACNLNLRSYPFDSQVCSIRVTSFAHPSTELLLTWFERNPMKYNSHIDLPEMSVVSMDPDYCNYTDHMYGETESVILQGDFGCLSGQILLQRAIGFHLVQTYIPTFLIVVISWLSFWIDRSAIPARITLSFTTLLTLATMSAGLRMSLPPVAYAKAIDYWVGTCTLFVFGALIEFALINTFMRKATSKKTNIGGSADSHLAQLGRFGLAPLGIQSDIPRTKSDPDVSSGSPAEVQKSEETKKRQSVLPEDDESYSQLLERIDMASRVAFPAGFIIFNAVYWSVYLPESYK